MRELVDAAYQNALALLTMRRELLSRVAQDFCHGKP
jgi:hypothetical protein